MSWSYAPPPADGDTEFAATARHLAARLLSLARPGPDGSPAWTGDDVDPSSPTVARLVHGPVDDGLLTGRAGIALALSTCARLPGGRPEWADVAVRTVGASLLAAHTLLARGIPGAAGWQSGAFGTAHAARWIGHQQNRPDLVDAARRLAATAVAELARNEGLVPPYPDLLDGVAGHLLAVLGADLPAEAEPARRALAGRLAGRLTATVTDDQLGARWPMAGSMGPVCGLAHGSSGGALALSEAASAGHGDEWEDVARAAVRWEAGHHDAASGGWLDLRVEPPVPALAWCHGALGIGIAAARRYRLSGDPLAMAAFARARSAAAAVEATTSAPFDATMCHGLGGLVELHLVAAEQLGEDEGDGGSRLAAREHLADARRVAGAITRAGRDGAPGWHCGLPLDGRTPVALTGLAGVALTMARCHDPSLLTSLALPGPAAGGWSSSGASLDGRAAFR